MELPGKVGSGSAKPTVLIVDDEPLNLEVLEGILEDRYVISAALSGERALEIAMGPNPPDVILLDVMMPGMNGSEVCRRLKRDPATMRIPVIFVTGMQEIDDEIKGFDLGCVDYIIKPVSAKLVVARVDTQVKLHRQEQHLLALLREFVSTGDARYADLVRGITQAAAPRGD